MFRAREFIYLFDGWDTACYMGSASAAKERSIRAPKRVWFFFLLVLVWFWFNVTVFFCCCCCWVSPVGKHDLFGRNEFGELKSLVYQRPFATKYRSVFHPQLFEWFTVRHCLDVRWMKMHWNACGSSFACGWRERMNCMWRREQMGKSAREVNRKTERFCLVYHSFSLCFAVDYYRFGVPDSISFSMDTHMAMMG